MSVKLHPFSSVGNDSITYMSVSRSVIPFHFIVIITQIYVTEKAYVMRYVRLLLTNIYNVFNYDVTW
jgi:hypothetical protein